MTDNEIIKEFDLFLKYSAPEKLLNDVLDLINRQKAEIARLKQDRYLVKENGEIELLPRTDIEKIKAEAIKEFAERLKKECFFNSGWCVTAMDTIDNLVKEMVGDNDV